jgi:hypothetical protein
MESTLVQWLNVEGTDPPLICIKLFSRVTDRDIVCTSYEDLVFYLRRLPNNLLQWIDMALTQQLITACAARASENSAPYLDLWLPETTGIDRYMAFVAIGSSLAEKTELTCPLPGQVEEDKVDATLGDHVFMEFLISAFRKLAILTY